MTTTMNKSAPRHNRYPGMRPFADDEADQLLFFGRTREIQDLFHQIRSTKLLVVYGKSGLGKTSLLQAGIFPRLRQANLLPLPVRLNDVTQPPHELFFTAIKDYCHHNKIVFIPRETESLWEFFKTTVFLRGDMLQIPVLVLDQFEEFFTLQDQTRRTAILRELADLTNGELPEKIRQKIQQRLEVGERLPYNDRPPEVKVVLSLREDYYGALQEMTVELPTILEERFRLMDFDEQQARAAIVAPAEVDQSKQLFRTHTFGYNKDVVKQLLTFLRGRSGIIEPFQLQLICQHIESQVLQEQSDGQENIEVTKEYLGDPDSMEAILKNFYMDAIGKITSKGERRRAKRVCEEGLLDPAGRRISLAEQTILNNYRVDITTLETLVDARLLRKEARLESFYYEISHDSIAEPVARSRRFRIPKPVLYAGLAIITVVVAGAYVLVQQQSHAKELAEVQARFLSDQLANRHWLKGLVERDENNSLLKASHHFMQAAAFTTDPNFSKNAQLAGAILIKDIYLSAALAYGDGVKGIVFEPDGKQILIRSADGKTFLWDPVTEAGRTLSGDQASPPALLHDWERPDNAALSSDQTRVITWSEDGSAQIRNLVTNIVLRLSPQEPVTGATFSTDGKQILTWNGEGTARLWNAATGAALTPPLTHKTIIWGARFSPDGKQLLTWSADGTARLWDAATGNALSSPLTHDDLVRGAVFNEDGSRVLTWSDDATARVWDSATSRLLTPPLTHRERVWGARFSPDEAHILTWSEDGTAQLWDSTTGAALFTLPLAHVDSRQGPVFSPDGRRILVWSTQRIARVWDRMTRAPLMPPLIHADALAGSIFSPDGKQILTWSTAGAIRLWEITSSTAFSRPLAYSSQVKGAAFSPDGRRILAWSADGTARLWDSEMGVPLIPPLPHQSPIRGAIFSPDGRQILTWGKDGTVGLWDGRHGTVLALPLKSQPQVKGAVFSLDGNQILIWSSDGAIRLWDRLKGDANVLMLPHEGELWGTALSPQGNQILTWGDDHTARVWDRITGDALLPHLVHDDQVRGASFSPDGQRILTWSLDKTAQVWDSETRTPLIKPLSHQGPVKGAMFSPDGRRILSWSADGKIHMWETHTGTAPSLPLSRLDGILGATFSPLGHWILTWDRDRTVRIWDSATGILLVPSLAHQEPVRGAIFGPEERRILTWVKKGPARVWTLPVDYTLPPASLGLQPAVRTGTRLNEWDKLEALLPANWKKQKQEYKDLAKTP